MERSRDVVWQASRNGGRPMRTPRTNIRYADRCIVDNHPMLFLVRGKKRDYLTPEEIIGDLYGKKVSKIDVTFEDETQREDAEGESMEDSH